MKTSHPFLASLFSGLSLMWLATCQSLPAQPVSDVFILEAPDGQQFAFAVPPAPPESKIYADFLVGRFAALTNQPDEASRRYASVVRAGFGDLELRERAVFSALIAGDYQTAVASAGVPAADAETASLSRLVRGAEALLQGRTEEAELALRNGGLGPFNRVIAQSMLGWALLETKGLDAARQELIAGLSGDALLDGITLYSLALMETSAGADDMALATFEGTWMSGVRLAIGAEAYARLLASKGRTDEAWAIITTFRDEVGPNPGVERLARELEAGKPVAARRLKPAQGAAVSVYAPAAALVSQTGDDVAGVYFTLALALDPELHVARTLWGDALDRADRREDAVAVLSAVPSSSEYYANARAQLAWVYRRLEQNDMAIRTAQDALAFRPDRDLKIQLGDLFRSLERYPESERVFSEVIAADEAEARFDWRLFYARGSVRERQDNWTDAETDMRRALELEPDRPETLNYLGYSLVDRGQKLDEAFAMIQRAVELRPDAGYIVDSLGWAYFRLGKYNQAVEHLERAVELDPGDPTINDHLGDAYWKVGRTVEARFQWARALTLEPTDADAAVITAKLKDGLVDPVRANASSEAVNGAVRP